MSPFSKSLTKFNRHRSERSASSSFRIRTWKLRKFRARDNPMVTKEVYYDVMQPAILDGGKWERGTLWNTPISCACSVRLQYREQNLHKFLASND